MPAKMYSMFTHDNRDTWSYVLFESSLVIDCIRVIHSLMWKVSTIDDKLTVAELSLIYSNTDLQLYLIFARCFSDIAQELA